MNIPLPQSIRSALSCAALVSLSLVLLAPIARAADNAPPSPFEIVGIYRGPGTLGWQGPNIHPPGMLVGPGPTSGSERVYLAYTYSGKKRMLDVLSVDPRTWEWQRITNPAPSEYGACMVVGPDGNIYFGTRPNAHILRLNPRTGVLVDLGQATVAQRESYIYQLTVASDGMIYGCTHPSARLLRCDPTTGKLTDLGPASPADESRVGEQYAYWIAASTDGFVYESVGIAQPHLIAYDVKTGERWDLLPQVGDYAAAKDAVVGRTPFVYRGDDNQVYAVAGDRQFRLRGWAMEGIPAGTAATEKRANRLSDGRLVEVGDGEFELTDPVTNTRERRPFTYEGQESDVFRLGAGPDGRIYGSSILPMHFFVVDAAAKRVRDYGRLGHGEVYSFVSLGGKLHLATYGARDKVPLWTFDPGKPPSLVTGPQANPRPVNYEGSDTGWRAEAMIAGPSGKIYVGAVAGYGKLDGPLTVWDPAQGRVEKFTGIVPQQSFVSLAAVGDTLVAGTTIFGGGGTRPATTEAKLVLWDTARRAKVWETVPVAGASRMTDFLALPGGKVMGVALPGARAARGASSDAPRQATLFVFDANARQIEHTQPFPWTPVYNSVGLMDDGNVWGLAREGVFRFNARSRTLELVAKPPQPITAGLALQGRELFYASGATIFRYRLP